MPVELYIGSIALVPIIVALIQVFKLLGMPVEWAPWVNLGLTVVGFAVVLLVWHKPESLETVTWVLNMMIVLLGPLGSMI